MLSCMHHPYIYCCINTVCTEMIDRVTADLHPQALAISVQVKVCLKFFKFHSMGFCPEFYLAYANMFSVLLMDWVYKGTRIISNLWVLQRWGAFWVREVNASHFTYMPTMLFPLLHFSLANSLYICRTWFRTVVGSQPGVVMLLRRHSARSEDSF